MGLVRAFREALRGLWRAGTVGLVSVVTTAASLLVLGMFAQVIAGGYVLVMSLKARVEVEAYLKDGLSRRRALALVRELEEMEGIAEARYIDKAAAALEFREMFGGGLLDALSRNPLPASLRIRLEGGGDLSVRARAVADALVERREVESVDVGESWLASLDRLLQAAVWVGALLGGVLCLACAFAVSNTAKLMVLAHREAIEVMRLVGATGTTIRLTFLMGGAIQGLAGGILGAAGIWVAAAWWPSWMPDPAWPLPFYSGVGVVALGTLLGIVGSWASLNRVLNAVSWK